jgi:hypothetical protein
MVRCNICKKKLGVMEFTCKCGLQLCISHLKAEEHACTYDYVAENKEQLKKQYVDTFNRNEKKVEKI